MFSTFPDGSPGLGLLVLRVAVAIGFIGQGLACIENASGVVWILVIIALISTGTLLLIGLFSRYAAIAAGIACVASQFSWFPGPRRGIFGTGTTVALALVIAAAIICLGSGAFSLDAKLFGRREVIIPSKSPTD